jgi:uncharacterized protein YodC (DUF2158 family)
MLLQALKAGLTEGGSRMVVTRGSREKGVEECQGWWMATKLVSEQQETEDFSSIFEVTK